MIGVVETYDEGRVLLLVSRREVHHRLDNLNARICVDVD